MPGFLDRSHSIAPADHDRRRVLLAALVFHLAIGQVFALNLASLPLDRLLGDARLIAADWDPAAAGWISTVAIVTLGLSAALFGRWADDAGPRKATLASTVLVAAGWIIAGLGLRLNQVWIVFLGYGVIGGIGAGIGYVAPMSALLLWFPDRASLSTGMTIAGFGAGSIVGAPLASALLTWFATAGAAGGPAAMIVLGAITFAVMSFGVFAIRLPAPGWKPPSFTSGPVLEAGSGPRAPRIGTAAGRSVSERKEAAPDVHVNDAMRTPQFWLLWLTIAIAVTAGLGALSQAAPMFRETFPLIISPTEIASFGSLLGASGVIGALLWSVLAGSIGRQRAIALALSLGAVSMVFAGAIGDMAGIWPFITTYVVIAAAFGGVFATIPAYLRDTFGVMHVGAIHGRIITAWTLAGMTGGALAHLARESRIALGMRSSDAFEFTLYGLAGALIVGLIANSFIGPVHPTHHYRRPT